MFFLLLSGALAEAQAFSELEFGSRYGRFLIQNVDNRFLYREDPVDLGTFKDFLPYFNQDFVDNCDSLLKTRPDLSVKMRIPDPSGIEQDRFISRHFYISENILSDGKKCVTVRGKGIYYVPLHSSWFDRDKRASLNFGPTFKLSKNGETIGEFKKNEGDWVDGSMDQFINWDFFEQFVESLENFKIDLRLHPAAGHKTESFSIETKGDTYHFYKVDKNIWAMKSPRLGWLLSSRDWAFWKDMGPSVWKDRFENRLRIILDRSRPLEEREETLKGLGTSWSMTIKHSLHKLLLDGQEEQRLKDLALLMLKRKPSLDNFKILVQALKATENPEFQSDLTKVLRIRNPKGPLIQPDDTLEKRQQVIQTWSRWWDQVKVER